MMVAVLISLHITRLVEKLHIKNQPDKAAFLEACVNKLVNSKESGGSKNVGIRAVVIRVALTSINTEYPYAGAFDV
jgi:hypothetical protein